MLNGEVEYHICCPYCGEWITILVDCSVPEQRYIEDCQVCCRPIDISAQVSDENAVEVIARHENE